MGLPPLPIDGAIGALRRGLASHRAAVLIAAPGAGKTTRVPPAVSDAGRVVVLQPRRVAARAVARRIAEEQGWALGREVGWHVRFERRFAADTRVLIVTEGMLTLYLDDDPLLSGVSTVILDEFHERSLHTDLGLALVAQAWRARDDLRVVVMSATMDPEAVCAYLDDCPLVELPGTAHPLSTTYAPGESVVEALAQVLPSSPSSVLCFLPGAGDIERSMREAVPLASRHDVDLLPLHGSLDADAQDRALGPGPRRRVVFATNIAETSLTVPDVSAVIDTGWQKVASYDAERAIDTLVLERVTDDSAAQRAGRAGRLGPGTVRRLWDRHDRLRAARQPEIHRVDLSAVILGVMAAGNVPELFPWFEAPDDARVGAARLLLERLGAIRGAAVTALGHQLRRLPVHPRLGRVLVEARGAWEAAAACALLSEARIASPHQTATTCDLLPHIDGWAHVSPHTRQVADALHRAVRGVMDEGASVRERIDERGLREALFKGYPDRVARRRAGDRQRVVLSSGKGAVMGRDSTVNDAEWMVALDLIGGRPGQPDAMVRLASRVEPEWIVATSREVEHRLDDERETVRAVEVERYDAITIAERSVPPDPVTRARQLAAAWREQPADAATVQLLRRARFAGLDLDVTALSDVAADSARRVGDIDLAAALPWDVARRIAAAAPAELPIPSGRTARLTYHDDGSLSAAVKLQELFGLAETPRLGPGTRAGDLRAARAQRPPGADDTGPPQLLGADLSRGAEAAARPLPEAPVARRSVDGDADASDDGPQMSRRWAAE